MLLSYLKKIKQNLKPEDETCEFKARLRETFLFFDD